MTAAVQKRIDKALDEYLRENLMTAHQLSQSAWMEIYHSAGLSDKEIAELRKEEETEENKKYERALDDKVEEYNS